MATGESVAVTVADYRRVLPTCLREARTQNEKKSSSGGGHSLIKDILVAHYSAPGHTTTSAALAERLRLTNYGAVNLRYGKFAGLVAKALEQTPKFNVAVLASFEGENPNTGSVPWTMHPALASALEELGWVQQPAEAEED